MIVTHSTTPCHNAWLHDKFFGGAHLLLSSGQDYPASRVRVSLVDMRTLPRRDHRTFWVVLLTVGGVLLFGPWAFLLLLLLIGGRTYVATFQLVLPDGHRLTVTTTNKDEQQRLARLAGR